MVSGDLPIELEVLLLQWGRAVLGFPLGNGEDGLWHQWFGFGFGFGCVRHPVGYSTYCNEIAVRLGIPSTSYRGWSILIVVALCALVPIAVGRCSPRGLVGMPVDKALLDRNRGDDDLGAHQHRDQHSGCPASTPNLARL